MALTDISKHAESVEGFINDLAEAFRKKRWIKILSLIGIAFALLLNPASVEYGLKFLNFRKPDWYSYLVWGIITVTFFLAAFLIAVLSTKEEEVAPLPPISIIKGLYPYTNTKEDADWFARLQRGNILQDCLRLCAGEDSFAILSGDSGAGKTSFLLAGLYPNLERQGRRPVYVKLTDSSPLDSLRQALNRDSENPISDDQHSLLECLRKATQVDARPIVIIFDQFEQFFTRHKSKASRKPFIQQMAEWYKQSSSLPVKILISIRGDFENRLNEFRREMKYALPPQNNLSLEKFEPLEAAQVIGVIAREAKIELDTGFVERLTKYELADSEGTVSPVDVQILSLMIECQKSSEERAFNLKAFQKLGGVEGLLERFLNKVLDARGTDTQRQAAIKVMLALTDQNVRAGALSLRDLKEKLRADIPSTQIEETVSWLARRDVRLVTTIQEKNITLYELAHERIILPLHRLALKEITDIEKAQQTLDRRVNEWLGNNRSRRYLLTFREWRLIRRYWTLIVLGPQKEQKEEFVFFSKKHFAMMGLYVAAALLLGGGGYTGYKRYERLYEERAETQIKMARDRLVTLSARNKDVRAAKCISILLPVLNSKEDQQLSQLLWQQINKFDPSVDKTSDPSVQAPLLILLAEAHVTASRPVEALKALENAQEALERLEPLRKAQQARVQKGHDLDFDFGDREGLLRLAEAYIKLSKSEEALNLLSKVQQAEPRDAFTNTHLAEKYIELSKPKDALSALDKAKQAVIREPVMSRWVSSLAELYAKLLEPKEALKEVDELWQALRPHEDSFDLQAFAIAYVTLLDADKEAKGLNKVKLQMKNLPLDGQAEILQSVADQYIKLSKTEEALKVLDETLLTVQQLPLRSQADRLLPLAEAYIKLSKPEEALKALEKIQQKIEGLPPAEQANRLPLLASTYIKLSEYEKVPEILIRAQQASSAMSLYEKPYALVRVASLYAKLHK